MMAAWQSKGFHVHCGPRIRPDDRRWRGRVAGSLLVAAALIFAAVAPGCTAGKRAGRADELAREVSTREGVVSYRGGTLREMEGVAVLELRGTPYEMGLAYGVLMRGRLAAVMEETAGFVDAFLASQSFLVRAIAPAVIRRYTRAMRGRIPAEYLEEIRGAAEGAGLSERDLLFVAAGVGLFSEPAASVPPHCTSVLVRLPDRIVHGRNFDFLPALMGRHPVVVHYRPEGGNGYWNFGVVGYLPSFHGINERGISITLNYGVASYDPGARGMPTPYKVRTLLQDASTLEDARRIVEGTPADEPGWILTVASGEEAEGTVFDILGPVRAESRFTEPGAKLVLNRMFSRKRYPDGELARRHLYLSDDEGEYNVAREHVATRALAGRRPESAGDLFGFLRLADFYGYRIPWNENASIANDYTLQSLVFDWTGRSVLFSWGVAYAPLMAVKRFDLRDDTLVPHAPADPLLEDPRYAWFLENIEAFQRRMLAGDSGWVCARADFDLADPFLVGYCADAWRNGGTSVSRETLLRSADRLISMYPDYYLPYTIRAALLEGDEPDAAIALHRQALEAPIRFVPDRIVSLSKIARLQARGGRLQEAAATARECLGLIEEMESRVLLDPWVQGIRGEMRALGE